MTSHRGLAKGEFDIYKPEKKVRIVTKDSEMVINEHPEAGWQFHQCLRHEFDSAPRLHCWCVAYGA